MSLLSTRLRLILASTFVICSAIVGLIFGAGGYTATEAPPFVPTLSATKTAALLPTGPNGDINGNGFVNPGDRMRYTVQINNTGPDPATGVSINDIIDANATLIGGSILASPVAVNDAFTSIGNVGISVPDGASDLLSNDLDANNPGAPALVFTLINASAFSSGTPVATTNGSVTVNSNGSFTYTPNAGFEGSDTFTYTLGNGTGLTDPATVSITVSGMIWFVQTGALSGGDGRLATPFNCFVGANCFDDTGLDQAGDNIFLYSGSYTGGQTMLDNQRLIGQGSSVSLASTAGIAIIPPFSNALPATGGANPVLTTGSLTDNIGLGTGNTIRGLTLGNSGGASGDSSDIFGNAYGTLTVNEVVLDGTGRTLNLTNGSLAATFTSITSTGSTSHGMNVAGTAGSMTVTGGTSISGALAEGILLGTSTANINFGVTTISAGTNGVSLQNNSGGTRTFSSLAITNGSGAGFLHGAGGGATTVPGMTTITNPGGNCINIQDSTTAVTFANVNATQCGATGVFLDDNTGAVTFADIDISPDANVRAFHATDQATGAITTTSGTIPSTGTAVAVEIIGLSAANRTPLNMQLTSVSANGAVNGIALTNTTGTFTITGNSSGLCGGSVNTATEPDTVSLPNIADCTGGTIQNTTNDAIVLTNAANVSLSRLLIQNGGQRGIEAINIGGSNFFKNGIITGMGTGGGADRNGIDIRNTDTNLTLFSVEDSAFTNSDSGTSFIFSSARGSSNMRLDVKNSLFDDLVALAVQSNAGDTEDTAHTVTTNITGNIFRNASSADGQGGVAVATAEQLASNNFTISNNTFQDLIKGIAGGNSEILLAQTTGGALNGTIANNVIGNATAGNGDRRAIGVIAEPDVSANGELGSVDIIVENNTVDRLPDREAIFIDLREDTQNSELIIRNNNIGNLAGFEGQVGGIREAVDVQVRGETNKTLNLLMAGNNIRSNATVHAVNLEVNIDALVTPNISMQATVTGNAIRNTSGADEILTRTRSGDTSGSMCLDMSGNTFDSGAGTIQIAEDGGPVNVEQANQASLASANGISAASVIISGTPQFNVSCTSPPSGLPNETALMVPIETTTFAATNEQNKSLHSNIGANFTWAFGQTAQFISETAGGLLEFASALSAAIVPTAHAEEITNLSTAPFSGETVSQSLGTLPPGENIRVQFDVTVDGNIPVNDFSVQNTAQISATNHASISSSTATTTVVHPPTISKAFGESFIALNGTTTLTFTVVNANPTTDLTNISFTDNLPAGLVVLSPPFLTNNCGGIFIGPNGATSVSLNGMTRPANQTCTIIVRVQATTEGAKDNTTGPISSPESGTGLTSNTATLNVLTAPTFTKAFTPNSIAVGGTSALSFTITNTSTTLPINGIGFTDTLPTDVTVAGSPNITGTCGGGTITGTANSGSISLSGATLPANQSCTFKVDVTASTPGVKNNIATLATTELGANSATTGTVPLNVFAPPTIAKAFLPTSVAVGGISTLTITITNPAGNPGGVTGIAVTDSFPAGLEVDSAPMPSNTCGGTFTSTAGASSISLTGGTIAAAGGSCAIGVKVKGTTPGPKVNTTGTVSSNQGGAGLTARATLDVVAPPEAAKSFAPANVNPGGTSLLTITITNPGANNVGLTGLSFTDNFPTGMTVAATPSLTNTCGGSVTGATTGSGAISLSGGTLATGSCTVSLNVTATQTGLNSVTVNSVNGGSSNAATATLSTCLNNPIVTTTADSGAGSLREALADVCAAPDNNIKFNISTAADDTITVATELVVGKDMNLANPDAAAFGGVTVSGGAGRRVFNVSSGITTGMNSFTVANGNLPAGNGGGISNSGTLTLTGMTLTSNTANFGSTLHNAFSGILNLVGTTLRNNTAVSDATIYNDGGAVNIRNSTITTNSGGGVFNDRGVLEFINSTVTLNTNNDAHSGIFAQHLDASDITRLGNTIVANNTTTGSPVHPDVRIVGTAPFNVVTSLGNNLIENTNGWSGAVASDITLQDPQLLALANNGGPTLTHALSISSPALDAGSNLLATNAGLTTDQRGTGFLRSLDAASDTNATDTVDIGAFEANPTIAPIADQIVNEDADIACLSFEIADVDALAVVPFTFASTNPTLVPVANITAGAGATATTRCLIVDLASNQHGTASITVTVQSTNGQSASDTFQLTVNAVNDPPSFSLAAGPTVNEDAVPQSVGTFATNILAGPPDEVGQTVAFAVTAGATTGGLTFATAPAIAPNGTLTYQADPNSNGTATFSVAATDDGTPAATSAAQMFTITVNAVNDPPSFTKGADQTVNEDAGAQTAAGWATSISQGPNETGQTLAFNVTGNTNPGLFSAAPAVNSANGNLTYTPAANANGNATITLTLSDNGGGTDTSAPQMFTITVNAVNDAPSFQIPSPPPAVNEDAGAKTVNSFATNFVPGPADEVTAGQTLVGYTVTQTGGSLTFASGPAISTAGVLTYAASPNGNGTATFNAVATDSGSGTAPNVNQSAPISFTITVNAVNDAPLNSVPSSQTIGIGNDLVFSGANLISIGDIDAASGELSVTLTVTNGTLMLGSTAGLSAVGGNGSSSVALTGTLTNINAALDGLKYRNNQNFAGPDTLQIVTNDAGNTGAGGPMSDTDTVAITVTCVTNQVLNDDDSGPGSLRQVVFEACPGGVITFASPLAGSQTISLSGGQIVIDKNLTIQGTGANVLTVQNTALPGATSRVFFVQAGATVEISGLTVSGGNVVAVPPANGGGGIFVDGTLTLRMATVSGNTSNTAGGGIVVANAGVINLLGSTVSGNTSSTNNGGGLQVSGTGSATVENATISGNSATAGEGGGIRVVGTASISLSNSTVTNNTAASGASGFSKASGAGTAIVRGSVIAGNQNNGALPDTQGIFISQGFNLIGNVGPAVGFVLGTDQVGGGANPVLDPRLAPLANNGGPTQTHALCIANGVPHSSCTGVSPAIDKGFCFVCGAPPNHDQRGVGPNFLRPFDLPDGTFPDATGGDGSDSGAYELNNTPPTIGVLATARLQGSPVANSQIATGGDIETPSNTLRMAVNDGDSATVNGVTVTLTDSNAGAGGVNPDGTGQVFADVSASCTATAATFTLTVTDSGGLATSTTLTVTLNLNTPPVITHNNASVQNLGVTTVSPTAFSDNGTATAALLSQGTYTGTISVNNAGVVSITNAGPIGSHTIAVRSTDNCGAPTDSAFTLNVLNNIPVINPAAAISRQQGTAASVSPVATTFDLDQTAGSLRVTPTTVPTGISVTGIANSGGNITAGVEALCNAAVGANTVVFTVNDSTGGSATANFTVNVTANTAPTLSFANPAAIVVGGGTTVTPLASPGDNGSITSYSLGLGTYTGGASVNQTSGVVTFTGVQPVGDHTITVSATDNCGLTTAATFTLSVFKANPSISTQASAGITLGSGAITDTANVAGRVSPIAGAAITFNLYGPNDATCATSIFTSTVAQPVGNGPVTSEPFTPRAAGTYRWIASYSGDANNNPASGACSDANESVTVGKATLTVTADPKARVYGQANPAFTETISGFVLDQTLATSGVTGVPAFTTNPVATAASAPGSYAIVPSIGTLAAANYSFVFANGNLEIAKAATTTAITNAAALAATSAAVGVPYTVNFAVSVTAPGAGVPMGEVTVSDGAGATCFGAVAANGTGSCQLTSTTTGPRFITATYPVDTNFTGSVSQAATTTTVILIGGNVKQFVANGVNTNLSGVTMTLTSGNAIVSTGTTDAGGNYVFGLVNAGGSYVVTPALANKVFEPISRTFANVTTSITNADFVAYDVPGPNANPRLVRVVNSTVTPGQSVTVPLEINAVGNERTMNLSLTYDMALVGTPTSVTCGSGATNCTVTINTSQPGRVGVTFTHPTPLAAGLREFARITFPTSNNTAANAEITFGDQPLPRDIRDGAANPLPAFYARGFVTFNQPNQPNLGLEGDVVDANGNPAGGDGVGANDVSMIRQFALGLITPVTTTTNQYQRADVGPRDPAAATFGDGAINASDVTVIRLYALGILPPTNAAGPTGPVNTGNEESERTGETGAANATAIRVANSQASPGGEVTIPIDIEALGSESSMTFTLNWNPAVLTYVSSNLGTDAPAGANLGTNTLQAATGKLGVLVDSVNAFESGTRRVMTVTFAVAPNAPLGTYPLTFSADPTSQSVSTNVGSLITASFQAGNFIAASDSAPLTSTISGKVLTPEGAGLRNAVVKLIAANGTTRTATTSAFGIYTFENVPPGQTYTLTVASKRFRFTPQTLSVTGNLTSVDLVGLQ